MMDIQTLSTVVSLLAMVVMYLITKPLQSQLESLQKSIDKLAEALSDNQHNVNDLRERVAAVENSAKSAHNRIDELTVRQNNDDVKCSQCSNH